MYINMLIMGLMQCLSVNHESDVCSWQFNLGFEKFFPVKSPFSLEIVFLRVNCFPLFGIRNAKRCMF